MALYRGFSFPFRKEGSSYPVQATDADLIRESLKQIVLTGRGERIMRPDFGTSALSYIFENNDLVLEENLRTEVFNSISKYEPRVLVTRIDAKREDTTLDLTIQYVILATRQVDTLSVPLGAT